jgi:hypothetical protein
MTTRRRSTSVPPGAIYISAPQVCDRYGGVSHMWLERKLKNDPEFPHPKYFGRLRFCKIPMGSAINRGWRDPRRQRPPRDRRSSLRSPPPPTA